MITRNEAGSFEQLLRVLRFQLAQKRVTGGWSETEAETLHCFTIQAAVFEIREGNFAFRGFVQLAREERRGFTVHLDERGPLLIFAAFFRRMLAGLGNRNAAFFGHRADRFRERTLVQFHHKFENVAAHTAAEAVINLPNRMHVERRRFFLVKRTQAGKTLAAFLQTDVFPDDADNVRLLLHAFRE